ncbi:hypothetical protein K469DRAFT_772048 [Zopfia rhizophila CBS 207.26]|uniref:Heterokaryon incompatibility domain-containing protein n=1 Tax=Zopfia rhizophila CBS 207.26 TaxID=1314779 RepID=A0A6A6EAB3_9PEZI|nr:hypothetical protein K469DRAFT_772048 [Zopfia rhizophila CBS 207.26]
MITPQWDKAFFADHPQKHQTTIILDRICDGSRDFATALETDLESLHPMVLLFLQKIKQLHLTLSHSRYPHLHPTIRKHFRCFNDASCPRIMSLQDEDSGILEHFYTIESTLEFRGQEHKRPNVTRTEIVLAFPVKRFKDIWTASLKDLPTFSYLPLGNFDFRFIIQADFLTAANRQSIDEDSNWNGNIARAIPRAFVKAVDTFNKEFSEPLELGKTWPLFLNERYCPPNRYWRKVEKDILDHLKKTAVLQTRAENYAKPTSLTFMDWAHDRNGDPIFGTGDDYISSSYPFFVRKALDLLGVTKPDSDWVVKRLRELHRDRCLHTGNRTMEWYSDLAKVLLIVRQAQPGTERQLETAPTASDPIYFPENLGVNIPPGLTLTIVQQAACECKHRKKLFKLLGVQDCDVKSIVERIINYHTKLDRAKPSDIIEQVKYLYHAREHLEPGDMEEIWFATENNGPFRRGVRIYPPVSADDELRDLFSGYKNAVFLHPGYLQGLVPSQESHLIEWLEDSANICKMPRLCSESGGMHDDFLWLLENKIERILGVLRTNWSNYNPIMTDETGTSVGRAKKLYYNVQLKAGNTSHKKKVRQTFCEEVIALPSGDFVSANNCVYHAPLGFTSKPSLSLIYGNELAELFQILRVPDASCAEVLEHLQRLRLDTASTMSAVAAVYNYLQVHFGNSCNVNNSSYCIAVPSPSGDLEWRKPSQCVWDDAEFVENGLELKSKVAIRRIIERDAPSASLFFTNILKLPNAGINELLEELKVLQEDGSDNTMTIFRLYERIQTHWRSATAAEKTRQAFTAQPLVFLRSYDDAPSEWLHLDQCIWRPSKIRTKYALMPTLEEFGDLFQRILQVPNATLNTLIAELLDTTSDSSAAVNAEDFQYCKDLLLEINRKRETTNELQQLHGSRCWPCSMCSTEKMFRAIGEFYVNDRQLLFNEFKSSHTFLDLDFDDSRDISDLLRRLGCDSFLSETVAVETEAHQPLQYDQELTQDYRSRAVALSIYIECKGCRSRDDVQMLLQNANVWMTPAVTTHYRMPVDSFSQPRVATKNEGGSSQPTLEIYFSTDRRKRECALVADFPEQLVEALEVRPADVAAEVSQLLQVHLDSLNDLLVRKGIISGTTSSSGSEEAQNADQIDENYQTQGLEQFVNEERTASSAHSQRSSDAAEPGRSGTESSISPIAETEEATSYLRPVQNRAFTSRPSTSPDQVRTPLESHDGPSSPEQTPEAFSEEPVVTLGIYNTVNRSHNTGRLRDFARNADTVFNARAQTTRRASSTREDAFDLSELNSALQEVELLQTSYNTINVRLNHTHRGGVIPDRSQEQRAPDFEVGFLGELFIFTILRHRLNLPNFSAEINWKSRLRSRAGFSPCRDGPSDFEYHDEGGELTRYFQQMQHPYPRPDWLTNRSVCVGMICKLINMYHRLRVTSALPTEIYVIVRVSGLNALEVGSHHQPQWRVYLDPYTLGEQGVLNFTAPTYAVTATG